MLIGLEKKFIFIANTKTGSTSIQRALVPFSDIRHGGTPARKHISVRDVQVEYASVFTHPGCDFDSFFKFGIMRDPADWVSSWFRYRKRKQARFPLPSDMTFEEFWDQRDWTFQSKEGEKNLQKKRFVSESGDLLMDRIIPYPELAQQFSEICDGLDIKTTLERANKSRIRASEVPIAPKLRRELEQFFEEDYDLYHQLTELNSRLSPTVHFSRSKTRPLGAEIDYMFLFAPNNSGSTIMSQYIASQIDGYVPPFGNYEGQNLPELQDIMMSPDRWSRSLENEWPQIRKAFDARREGSVFVEASPPNIKRVDPIRREFGDAAQYVFSICNPYQTIASCVFNYFAPPIERAVDTMASRWADRAATIRRAMEENPDIPFLSYEAFCEDPGQFNRLFGLQVRPHTPLDGKKSTQVSEIRNMATRTISFFSESEIDYVTERLTPHRDLLDHFGHRLETGADLLASFAGSDEEIELGERRRAQWEAGAKRRIAKRTSRRVAKNANREGD